MKIPEIPKIPTDNLYKFMAISQLKDMLRRTESIHQEYVSFLAPWKDKFSENELEAFTRWNPDWNRKGVKGSDF